MNHTVKEGDVLDLMDSLEKESIDVIVTSPPYNIGVDYGNYKDNLPAEEYETFIFNFLSQAQRVLKPEGSLFYNVGTKPSTQEYLGLHLRGVLENFDLQNLIIWVKSIYIHDILPVYLHELLALGVSLAYSEGAISKSKQNKANAFLNLLVEGKTFGHNKPCNSDRFLNSCWEPIIHATKHKTAKLDKLAVGVPYTCKSEIKRRKKTVDLKDGGNIWYVPYQTVKSKKEHPAAFPPELPEKCIKLHGIYKDMVVLDPFCGAGNTGLACKKLDVDFIGLDLNPDYVSLAKSRIELL